MNTTDSRTQPRTKRQIVYDFLGLPTHRQVELAENAGVYLEGDLDLDRMSCEMELAWIKRAKEKGSLDVLLDAEELRHSERTAPPEGGTNVDNERTKHDHDQMDRSHVLSNAETSTSTGHQVYAATDTQILGQSGALQAPPAPALSADEQAAQQWLQDSKTTELRWHLADPNGNLSREQREAKLLAAYAAALTRERDAQRGKMLRDMKYGEEMYVAMRNRCGRVEEELKQRDAEVERLRKELENTEDYGARRLEAQVMSIARAEQSEATVKALREAANLLIDYCEAHDWGTMPEPYASINPLLKLLGRAALKEKEGQ